MPIPRSNVVHIDNPADPRLDVYRNQRDAWLRARHNPDAPADASATGLPDPGLFMAEGRLVLEQALESDVEIVSVLVGQSAAGAIPQTLARVPQAAPILVVANAWIQAVVGFDLHRGVLACCRRPPPTDPLELARGVRTLVALEDLSNHDNVGGVFRSAAALAGPDVGVLLSPRCCDPLYRKAVRVSMGQVLRVGFATLDRWPAALADLRRLGFVTLALTPGPDAESLRDVEPPGRVCLLVGAEGAGLTAGALGQSDRRVRIPMSRGVDSLNASVAAAIALHHLAGPGDGA